MAKQPKITLGVDIDLDIIERLAANPGLIDAERYPLAVAEQLIRNAGGANSQTPFKLLRKMDIEGVTVHGFRSSMRDWAGEITSHPADICEAALSHRFSAVRGVYQRGDLFAKRRLLMCDWDAYCGTGVQMERAA